MILPLDIINGAFYLLMAVGVTIFGVGSLRTAGLSRSGGGLLLVFAAAWGAYLGAIPAYGFPIPTWFFVGCTGPMAATLFGIGYFIWTDAQQGSSGEPALDSTG